MTRGELAEAGVKAPGRGPKDEGIDLDRAGLRYRYDEARQHIYFELSDDQRLAKIYDSRGERPAPPPPTPAWGALLNYSTFAAASTRLWRLSPNLNGVNTSFDMRLFSPYGVVTQTAIAGNTPAYDMFRIGSASGMRLDTSYTYADPENLVMYRAGDVISGGFQWTRPVRLGGVQAQRNFALRADLVTTPLPSVSGSAAVPSTVDVYVNGSKTYSQQVAEGPYSITNLPISTSNGKAEVVIRDAAGRETKQDLSLFSGQNLIAPGMVDFSLELGATRRFYGLRSFNYDKHPVGSGSVRYGLTERLTLKGHAEGGARLGNVGAGVATSFGAYGNVEVAISASRRAGPTLQNGWRNATSNGAQAFASYSVTTSVGVGFSASAQQTFGEYDDLASTTAEFALRPSYVESGMTPTPVYLPGSFSGVDIYPPRTVYRLTANAPLYGLGGNASATFAQVTRSRIIPLAMPKSSSLVSVSYTRADLPFDGTLFLTAYADLNPAYDLPPYPPRAARNIGLFVGVNFPIGKEIRASVGAQSVPNPLTGTQSIGANAQVQKTMGGEVGSYGWSLNATQGETSMRGGSASYRSAVGIARITGVQQGRIASGMAQFDGAIAVTPSGVAAGPPVNDSFALVNAGAPDVTVLHDNRPVGKTNFFGSALVPTLRAYERNKIAIDANTLPPDAIPATTEAIVAPMYRSGVGVDFGVETKVKSATLILKSPDGTFIETGRRGRVNDGERFMVGYDGRAYVRRLAPTNTITVNLGDRDCAGIFDYDPSSSRAIEVVCR